MFVIIGGTVQLENLEWYFLMSVQPELQGHGFEKLPTNGFVSSCDFKSLITQYQV
jgi:hypothetical protein